MSGILSSQIILPSLGKTNPNDIRHGEGQYFSDVQPGTMTGARLSRLFLGHPFRPLRFTHYVAVDLTGLPVISGRAYVYVLLGNVPLDVRGRVAGFGSN